MQANEQGMPILLYYRARTRIHTRAHTRTRAKTILWGLMIYGNMPTNGEELIYQNSDMQVELLRCVA